jgi:hypothetical protein
MAPSQATGILNNRQPLKEVAPFKFLVPFESLYLEFEPLVDPKLLRKRISVLAPADKGELTDRIKSEEEMAVFFMKGTVSTCEEKENLTQETFLDISGSASRLHIVKAGTATALSKGVLFVGVNLDKQRLLSILLSAKSSFNAKMPLRTKDSITPAE